MVLITRTTRPSDEIRAEIEQTFGFLPPFFDPALKNPQVLGNLWQQTLAAYVLNPLSALFKERLNALLSRYCATPYCMIVHSSALRPLGMTARQVLALLDESFLDQETPVILGSLLVPSPEEAAAPASDSPLEQTLLYCAAEVFLERAETSVCQAELRRLLGPDLYPHLVTYLAYIKTCHTWIEAHPEVSHEADRRAQDNLGPLLAEEPALADFFRDYQARVMAQGLGREGRRAAAEKLRAEQAHTAGILESISDAFFSLDTEWRFTYVNEQAERVIFQKSADVLGRVIWDVFPDLVNSQFEREYRRAATEGVALTFEEFFPTLDSWYDVRVYPSSDGISVFFQQVNERKRAEAEREHLAERERFLTDLAERARLLTDPDDLIADALRSVGQFLGLARCVFVDIDIEADICTCRPDYRANESVVSMEGVSPISAFGDVVVAEYGAGHAVAVEDVRLDRAQVPAESITAYDALGIRAHVGVPVVHSSRLVSCIGAHSATPRQWTTEEVELLRVVVERTWLTVEVLRQDRALLREAEERREAHERTVDILESVADAFYAVDADFRFTYVNCRAEALWGRRREELLGKPFLDVFPQAADSAPFDRHKRVMTERETTHYETVSPIFGRWVEVSIYPTADGGLSIFFRDIEERKGIEEERERLAERERNIAEQLQTALTPSIPEHIPGMGLTKYYQAALTEAGVGGDFYDVFPVDKGCTALVVGDLSGKGLAAASQVATVRNMLRYALYRARTITGAVEGLNALLVEQRLLSGFATLFVGAYDSGARTLTFVNCGQEPALIRRAETGRIEFLSPTGPILGSFDGAVFEEQTVALGPGDVLAVFTDGLTEVGGTRTEMLGVEGVAHLLAETIVHQETDNATEVAEGLALQLITGVDTAAKGGVMRDDMCLLVGVVDRDCNTKTLAE